MGCGQNQEVKDNIVVAKKRNNQSIGINIGALNTVYSIFSNITGKYITNVLLMNNTSRTIKSLICYTSENRLYGENANAYIKKNLST